MEICPTCPEQIYKNQTHNQCKVFPTPIPTHTLSITSGSAACLINRVNVRASMAYVACVCVPVCSLLGPPPLQAMQRLDCLSRLQGRADFPAPLALFAWLLLCLIPGWISIRIMSTPPSSPPATLLLFSCPPPPLPLHLSFPAGCSPSTNIGCQ